MSDKETHHEWMSVDVTPTTFAARVVEVIETNLEKRGAGTEEDPVRRVTQYYTLNGKLLFEHDPCALKGVE